VIRWALILDTETTGVEETDACIEVACCLYDLDGAFPMTSYSTLMDPRSEDQGGDIGGTEIHGITARMLDRSPHPPMAWTPVVGLAAQADVLVAHNADFDRRFVPDFGKPWVCTVSDIEWPGKRDSRSLPSLALSLGVGVVSAHRAMADVDTLVRILNRVAETHLLVPMFERALRPKTRFVAVVPSDQSSNALVKNNGFRWDDERREWWRKMPMEDVAGLPFNVEPCEISLCRRFVAMLPYEQRQLAKDSGFAWDGDRREWWRSMQPNVAACLPFRVVERA